MQDPFREYAIGQLPINGPTPEEWLLQERLREEGSEDWRWFFDTDPLRSYFRGRWGQYALESGVIVPADYYEGFSHGAAFQRLQMLDPTREIACFYNTSKGRFSETEFKHIIILPLVLNEDEFYGTLINGNKLSISDATESEASRIFLYSWGQSEGRSRAHRAREHMCNAFEQALAEPVVV